MLRPGNRFHFVPSNRSMSPITVAAANGSPSAQVDDVRCHQDRGAEGSGTFSRRLRVYHFSAPWESRARAPRTG